MLIVFNIFSAIIMIPYLIYGGWFGEKLQSTAILKVNEQYDRELLMVMAQIQAGNGTAVFNSEGMIVFETERNRFNVYADDYNSYNFGKCYVKYTFYDEHKESWNTSSVDGDLSLDTRRYLLAFKENYMGIKDISSARKKSFYLKKEKVTIK